MPIDNPERWSPIGAGSGWTGVVARHTPEPLATENDDTGMLNRLFADGAAGNGVVTLADREYHTSRTLDTTRAVVVVGNNTRLVRHITPEQYG